jgi:hypothetical protein
MPIKFNTLLRDAGIDLKTTRLLRHQDARSTRGRTPYRLWRYDRDGFELYQQRQNIHRRPRFRNATHWVSFVGTPQGDTLFVGVYAAKYVAVGDRDVPMVQSDGVDQAGTYDVYELRLQSTLVRTKSIGYQTRGHVTPQSLKSYANHSKSRSFRVASSL